MGIRGPDVGDVVQATQDGKARFGRVVECTEDSFSVEFRDGEVQRHAAGDWRRYRQLAPDGLAGKALDMPELSLETEDAADLVRRTLRDIGDDQDSSAIKVHVAEVVGDADAVERWWKRKQTRTAITDADDIEFSGRKYSLVKQATAQEMRQSRQQPLGPKVRKVEKGKTIANGETHQAPPAGVPVPDGAHSDDAAADAPPAPGDVAVARKHPMCPPGATAATAQLNAILIRLAVCARIGEAGRGWVTGERW